MGIMNLFHKKKADDLAFDTALGNDDAGFNLGMSGTNDPVSSNRDNNSSNYGNTQQNPMGSMQQGFNSNPYQPSFSQNQHASFTHDDNYAVSKELEVISSKLDAIKAMLESMNQRISNLERENYPNRNQRW